MPEIQNPNLQTPGSGGGSGGDMRSTMAFMLLAMAVIFGYQFFFAKPKTDQQPQPAQTQQQTAAPPVSAAPGQTPAASAPAQAHGATPQISASLETDTTIENEFYKIVFTNRGAQVKSWTLKKYFDIDRQTARPGAGRRPPPASDCRSRSLPTSRRSRPS